MTTYEEWTSALSAIAEILQEKQPRKNALSKECRLLGCFTRLEILLERAPVPGSGAGCKKDPENTQPPSFARPQLERHLHAAKHIAQLLLRAPSHPNKLPLLAMLTSPW
ncbi:hypothetical protein NEDG_01408 [Nematocida displodere]|uniref:Uncharacterized protein n=1 Tax=Nematocida displodere TaxID=1805483 RepID=A0A177EBL6_9MICR|nr:hypothetical protein NEDG_01408 [Nematocida displodere]